MCRFDSPCKANKPTGHETESTTRKRGRLPSNGLSSFRSRDVEHRHYVVCRRVAGLSASPAPAKAQRRNRPENTRGDRAREDFSNANFIPFPSSLVPPSLFFPHLRFRRPTFLLPSFLPSTFFSNCYSFQRSRGIVFTHRRSTRLIADHSCPLPSFTPREKQERERERINEF